MYGTWIIALLGKYGDVRILPRLVVLDQLKPRLMQNISLYRTQGGQ